MITILNKLLKPAIVLSLVIIPVIFSSCEEEKETEPVIETSTMTDVDGNVYKTVKIGNQWWMAEDLKTTKFRDGSPIQQMQSATGWTDQAPMYCLFDNNPQSPGLLYNWFAISASPQIAPEGWRIPSDEDWKELERYLGMDGVEADKTSWRGTNEGNDMKIEGTKGWDTYGSNWPENKTGFSAIAGGSRLWDGTWSVPGLLGAGFWWSATEYESDESWYRHLDYKRADIFRYHALKNHGFAVRCIKE